MGALVEAAVQLRRVGTHVEVVGYSGQEGPVSGGSPQQRVASLYGRAYATREGPAVHVCAAQGCCPEVGPVQVAAQKAHWVRLEVTLYACRDNATIPTPECEQQVLEAVLSEVVITAGAGARTNYAALAAAGGLAPER